MKNDKSLLLRIEDLHIQFKTPGGLLQALCGVSLSIKQGEIFGVAGEKLGVIYPQGVGYDFIDYLLHTKGFDLIEIPEDEVNGCPSNLLVLEPGKVIMPAGNPCVTGELRKRGIEVLELNLSEFTRAGGGPTCMTIPLVRDYEK